MLPLELLLSSETAPFLSLPCVSVCLSVYLSVCLGCAAQLNPTSYGRPWEAGGKVPAGMPLFAVKLDDPVRRAAVNQLSSLPLSAHTQAHRLAERQAEEQR
eukprot:SAG22_NODE_12276_length_449_cov_0.822857_2_plen_100_part_01